MSSDQGSPRLGKRLDTWKEIGAFFGRDERTVKRWETTRGLPVHRVPGSGRANVYAYTEELTGWLNDPAGKPDLTADDESISPESKPAGAEQPGARPGPRTTALLIIAILVAGTGLLVVSRYWRQAHVAALPLSGPGASAHKVDPQAQDLYLKGIYYWHKRTPESLNQAVDYFTQAIVRDPTYAEAYVGLANCYNLLREYSSMPPEEAYPRAKAAAERAITLDNSLSAAHSSLAFVDFFWSWDAASAEKEFQRALALDPNSVPAHHWYATALLSMGRFPQSLAEIEKAQKLDPQSAPIIADRGLILYTSGQTEEGIRVLRELENSDPAFLSPHRYLADIYLAQGDSRNFLVESRKVATMMHDDKRMALVVAGENGFAASGTKGTLLAILKAQQAFYDRGQQSAYDLARTHAFLGQDREALDFLQIAYTKHDSSLLALRTDMAFKKLRPDPIFQKILAQVGLST
jgi:tetratricopeptide (TPR) repeat protein